MMEELVGEGLLAVDHTSETASLTDKGRQAL
jgi:predicted transcriptional regulator